MNYTEYIGYKNANHEDIKNKLRSPNGVQLTEALFEEAIQTSSRLKYEPIYSLREFENKGKPSAYQIYMHSVDETDAALKLVGSLPHWRKLCSLDWFLHGRPEIGFEGLLQWRLDIAERDRTFAKQILQEQASEGNITAAKAIEKSAQDDLKQYSATRKRTKKPSSAMPNDGLEFLDTYRSK